MDTQSFPYRAIIFDVDGTLVTTKSGDTFRRTADDWKWLPKRQERCLSLAEAGIKLGIATNQAGVAFSWSRFTKDQIHQELALTAYQAGVSLWKVCYTTPNEKALPEFHNPNDQRRKPGPGMILELVNEFNINEEMPIIHAQVLFVGDRDEDKGAAEAAGVAFQWANDFFNHKEER